MTIEQLKVFRDIAQTNSISRGAAMNGISQSAASQNLKHLEKNLGVELFDRTNRPLRLTPAGRLYLTACRDIVRRYEEAESQIEALQKGAGRRGTRRLDLLHRPLRDGADHAAVRGTPRPGPHSS